jgi:ubiquinone/menaquinone biosynthesis C-methylase UbiE
LSPADARALIAHPSLTGAGPQSWADLGAGDGTFTVALASLLPARSVIHAIDLDRRALAEIPERHGRVEIVTHVGDFTSFPWPFSTLDGLLMANSLHYVADQSGFLQRSKAHLARPRILLVEYDTNQANPWVPFPLGYEPAVELFKSTGYDEAMPIGRRRSRYRRADIYSVLFATIAHDAKRETSNF